MATVKDVYEEICRVRRAIEVIDGQERDCLGLGLSRADTYHEISRHLHDYESMLWNLKALAPASIPVDKNRK